MTRIAVLDDWQGVARGSADWSALMARAEVVFFADAFAGEDAAAAGLADFDIVLSMRERTPLPAALIARLPKLRMLGITGARNLSLDVAACTAGGVVVCHTTSDGRVAMPPPPNWHSACCWRRRGRFRWPTPACAPAGSSTACRSASRSPARRSA